MTTNKSQPPSASDQTSSSKPVRSDLDDLRSLIKDMAQQIGTRLSDLEGRTQSPSAKALLAPNPAHAEPASTTSVMRTIPSYAPQQTPYSASPPAPTPAVEPVVDGWDSASAEALTQIYEGRQPTSAMAPTATAAARTQPQVFYVEGSEADVIVPPKMFQTRATTQPQAIGQPAAARQVESIEPKTSTPVQAAYAAIDQTSIAKPDHNPIALDNLLQRLSEDRAWLDGRLQELAARVDANIDHSTANSGLDTLTARLASLEEQLTPALGSLVTRADLANMADMDAITALERQLDSLATAISETRHDLTRLDAIEATLNDLASYAAEARAFDEQPQDPNAQNFAATEPATPHEPIQIDALAEATANRVAEQMAHLKPEATDRIAHLHDLVQELIVERKRNDEQVASTLDTLQEALVRLIERVEGYDEQAFEEGAHTANYAHEPQSAPHAHAHVGEIPQSIAPVEPRAHEPAFAPDPAGTASQYREAPTISAADALAQTRRSPRADQTDSAVEPEMRATSKPIFSKEPEPDPQPEEPNQRMKAPPIAPRVAQPAQHHDFEEVAQRSRGAKSARGGVRMTVSNEDDTSNATTDNTADQPLRKRPIIQVVAAAVSCIALSYFAYLFLADRTPNAAMLRTERSASVRVSQPAATPQPRETAPQTRALVPAQPQPPVREGMEPPGMLPPPRDEPVTPAAVTPAPLPREILPLQPVPPSAPAPAAQPIPRQQPQPQSALPRPVEPRAEAPTTQPAAPAPTQQRRPRSQPETVTDELSDGADQVPPTSARIATASVVPKSTSQVPQPTAQEPLPVSGPQGLPGLAIQTSPMRAEDVYAAQQRRAMAARSQTAAERAFNAPPAPVAKRAEPEPVVGPVTPAKAQPDTRAKADDLLPVGMPTSNLVQLPPAAIGPTSLRSAAAQGDTASQFEVAARFAEGRGVKQDFRQAHDWYQRAATKGHVPSQYRLGTLFERGLGVPADVGRAKAWYKRAAEQGNIKAMHNLAVLSANTEGQSPDYTTAAQWFVEAANRGLSDSQFNLAVLHENGLGVRKDMIEAAKWYTLAARAGDPEATKRRDALRARLSAAENARLEQTVAAFKRKPVNQKANEAKVAGLISITPRR